MVTAPTIWKKARARRKWFEITVMPRASVRTGTRPSQNFDQRKRRMETGAVRTIQNAGPSTDTAGKTKRTATADMTKAAMARLTNA